MRLLMNNGLSAEGIRSMVPFIQNSNNITYLHLSAQFTIGRIQCAVSGITYSSIEFLGCCGCGIESMEIDHFPKQLKSLDLDNRINADDAAD